MNKYFVADTNTLVSAVLSPFSTNAQALKKAEMLGSIVYSGATWTEFLEVLFRKKFDKYFTIDERNKIASRLQNKFVEQSVTIEITACRDPKDNMFLELAVACHATCIVTGDSDLLALHPFRGIAIVTASDFIALY